MHVNSENFEMHYGRIVVPQKMIFADYLLNDCL